MTELELLIRDKYDGDTGRVTAEDRERLLAGEPLAYVIGWVPFLGLKIGLDSKPLIPRPETEWWTELLVERIGNAHLTVLDLCAGSGAIGLAVLKYCPNAIVAFGELSSAHAASIERTLEANGLDAARHIVGTGDLFRPFPGIHFDIVATNPPYIPAARALEASLAYEPKEALYAGADGLDVIKRIAKNAPHHMLGAPATPTALRGELWLEADVANIHEAARLLAEHGAERIDIRTDLYGRERLVLAYY
jgi:release factor glutamine methyltransferase